MDEEEGDDSEKARLLRVAELWTGKRGRVARRDATGNPRQLMTCCKRRIGRCVYIRSEGEGRIGWKERRLPPRVG